MTPADDGSEGRIRMRSIVDKHQRDPLHALCRQLCLEQQGPHHGEMLGLWLLVGFPGLPRNVAIIQATARCGDLRLATRKGKDFPQTLGG